MNNESHVSQLSSTVTQMNIYLGSFIYLTGLFGSIFNIIIFSSLKTFRQTPCGFYLISFSCFNLGQIVSALTTRILDSGFSIHITSISSICKIRKYFAQSCVLLSLTTLSLVTIDQYFRISTHREWSKLTCARRLLLIACSIWFLHSVSALIYWDVIDGVCCIINSVYLKYMSYFYLPVLLGVLPTMILILFASLAFWKIRKLDNREMNIIRLSHERQLTAMALSQVIFTVFALVPYTIVNMYDLQNNAAMKLENNPKFRVILTVVVLLYYEQFSSSFYIFLFVSKRFRRQFFFVLIKIHTRWFRKCLNRYSNRHRVHPQISVLSNGLHGDEPSVSINQIRIRQF